MMPPLIIAGSAEGHALARALPGASAVLPGPLRSDPGDVDYSVLADWTAEALAATGQGPVVLATHPCDPALRNGLFAQCQARGRPLLHLIRPEWQPGHGDRWHMVDDDAEVGQILPRGARVFVGLGRGVAALEPYLAGRYLVIRQLGARGEVFAGQGHYLDTDAPVSVADEIAMLRAERIDWLLVRNAGGVGGWPKLAAARALGLPVVMLPRPARMAAVPVAANVEEALAWLKTL